MAAGVVLNRRCASMLVAATLAMCPWLTDAARAQSTWLPTSGTTPWTTTTAWSNDLVPNGIGAGAVFPTATVTALLDDTTVTLGTINQTTASGNVVIGSTGTAGSSTDWINLEAASGVPVINVTGGNLYMYAQLTGSQGLSKTGGGVYSPRYNSLDFTYTGTNYFSGGTVQIARDGQLGDAANPIEVLGSTVLQSWSFPTTTWSTTRPITISTGLLTIQNGTAANTAALGGAIAGSGSLTLNTGNFLIGGPTSYTGATTIRSATVSLSGGAILSSAPLSLQTSAANTGGSLVDFGGGSQTVANLALTLASGGTAQAVNTFRNGSLTVTGGNLNVNSGASSAQSGTTQLDLKGLSAFSWGNGAGNLVLNTTSTVSSSTTATIMSLPTSGSASLSAAHVQIANSSNGPASSTSTLSLGLANSISTGTLTVGAYRGNGIMAFAPDVSGGSLVLRGPAGGDSRVDHVYIGFKSGGDNFGNGSIDVASGSIDARVANFTVGLYYANASNTQSSTFTMTSGTVDITTLSLGVVSVPSGTAGTPVMNDLFNQSGGTVRAESLVFGANSATFGSNNPSFRGTFTLAGGTFAVGSVSSGTGVSAATSQRRFIWSGGTLTTLSGSTDLTMTGASGSGGSILFTVSGTDAKAFDVPTGSTATLGDFVTLSGSDAGFTKSGGGRLVVGGASGFTSTFSGSASVQEGTLRLGSASALASATLVPLAGGTAEAAPYVIASVAGLNLSGTGLVDVTNGGLTVTNGLSAADLVAALIAGRNGGTWDGTSGITSSVTAAQVANFEMRAVGWLDNGDGSMTTAYAAQGDTNLDWVVDILDVSNFVASGKFGTGEAATWSEGDFNYDGVVDIQDVADFSATGLYGGANYNTPPGSAISAVPEPTIPAAAALVAVGGWWATKRRR